MGCGHSCRIIRASAAIMDRVCRANHVPCQASQTDCNLYIMIPNDAIRANMSHYLILSNPSTINRLQDLMLDCSIESVKY